MFRMTNEMQFEEPREVVFDFLSDDRNEAHWDPPNVSKIEKTSPGPVGVGTTFVGLYAPRDYEMHVRILEYDRPRRVARETIGKVLDIGIELDFAEENGGTRVAAKWAVQPKGPMRLLTPMLRSAFRKQLVQREAQIKRGLAKHTAPETESAG
jgi:carbon monoxide dehydrogenase subunit G